MIPHCVTVSLAAGANPVVALGGTWQLLCALRGTVIEIQDGQTALQIDVR
jgi:hypothetical protein